MKTFKMIKKIVEWVIVSVVIIGGILIYMAINHPYLFDRTSQQQVEKEWNQPITPSVCYTADCRR